MPSQFIQPDLPKLSLKCCVPWHVWIASALIRWLIFHPVAYTTFPVDWRWASSTPPHPLPVVCSLSVCCLDCLSLSLFLPSFRCSFSSFFFVCTVFCPSLPSVLPSSFDSPFSYRYSKCIHVAQSRSVLPDCEHAMMKKTRLPPGTCCQLHLLHASFTLAVLAL